MSLYKRGSTWWIDFTTSSGERVRRSAETSSKVHAQQLHDQAKVEAWRSRHLGQRTCYRWEDATAQWLSETKHKRTHREDELKLAWLSSFLNGRPLSELTREELTAIGECKRSAASAATANRYLALVRAVLRKACHEWAWIDKVPKVRLYREPARRVRWLTQQQARRLLEELPDHQRAIVLFALATGLRQGNVVYLRWEWVDLRRGTCWIPEDEAKAGEDLHVSLNGLALEVLRRQQGKHPDRVFTYRGKPIAQANTKAWRKALRRAGITDFRWHDLRHTWASWLVQNGTPLYDLQEMGGWKTAAMVRRYAHLAPANMARHAAVIDDVLHVTTAAQ
jgi:integrase